MKQQQSVQFFWQLARLPLTSASSGHPPLQAYRWLLVTPFLIFFKQKELKFSTKMSDLWWKWTSYKRLVRRHPRTEETDRKFPPKKRRRSVAAHAYSGRFHGRKGGGSAVRKGPAGANFCRHMAAENPAVVWFEPRRWTGPAAEMCLCGDGRLVSAAPAAERHALSVCRWSISIFGWARRPSNYMWNFIFLPLLFSLYFHLVSLCNCLWAAAPAWRQPDTHPNPQRTAPSLRGWT